MNEDLEVARRLAESVTSAELFLYRANRHLVADGSLPDYDEEAAPSQTTHAWFRQHRLADGQVAEVPGHAGNFFDVRL